MRTTPIDFDVLPLRPEYLQPLAVWNFGHNTCTCVRSAPENYICNQSESNSLTGRGFPDAKRFQLVEDGLLIVLEFNWLHINDIWTAGRSGEC